jgi:hypothetical protein
MLTAPAGAGKGEVLRTVAHAHVAAGHHVVGLAVAGETAQRLGAELGTEAMAVDLFCARVTHGRLTPKSTDLVIVDEAALLETLRWRSLLRAAGDARVIVAGDGRQLNPIEAGGMWPVLLRDIGGPSLMENYRARESWARDAWSALRGGHSAEAIRAYAERGLIYIERNRAEARERAVALWDEGRRAGARRGRDQSQYLLLVDGSNREVDILNGLAQERRLANHELGPTPLRITVRDEERGYVRDEALHAGDRIVATRAIRLTKLTRRIENGERGTVVLVTPKDHRAVVALRDDVVTLEGDALTALRRGYAQHVYSSQGRTVDEVYVVTGGWQTDRASSYVAVSRARDASYVISDTSSLEVEPGDHEAGLRELTTRMAVERTNEASIEQTSAAREGVTLSTLGERPAQAAWASLTLEQRRLIEDYPPQTLSDVVIMSKPERAYQAAILPPRYLADRVTDRVLEWTDRKAGVGEVPSTAKLGRSLDEVKERAWDARLEGERVGRNEATVDPADERAPRDRYMELCDGHAVAVRARGFDTADDGACARQEMDRHLAERAREREHDRGR